MRFLFLPALAGAACLLAVTTHGIGIFPDSVMYVGLARSLLEGAGYVHLGTPIAWFPPLYPLVLAAAGAFGAGVPEAARILAAVIWAGNIFWAGMLARELSGRRPPPGGLPQPEGLERLSTGAGLIAAVAALASVDLLVYHAAALSDGLFLLLTLPGMLFLIGWLRSGRFALLTWSAIAFACASLTRYAGLAWVLGGSAAIIFSGRRDARRFTETLYFALVALLPVLLWMLRNAQFNAPSGRTPGVHSFLGSAEVRGAIDAMNAWFFQWRMHDAWWMLLLPAGAIAIAAALRRRAGLNGGPAGRVVAIFTAAYALQLLCSAAFLQADLFRDSSRILLPLHLFLLAAIASALPRFGWRGTVAGCAVIAALFASSGKTLGNLARDGQGYAGYAYRESPLLAKVAALDHATAIYANLILPIDYYAERKASYVPLKVVNASQEPNPSFDAEMTLMAARLREGSAVIVWFSRGNSWLVLPGLDEIGRSVPLRCLDAEPDGGIYCAARER